MNSDLNIYSFKNEIDWKRYLFKEFKSLLIDVLKSKSEVNIAISGGQTPVPFYKYIYEKSKIDKCFFGLLKQINFFWVDERSVSIDHINSNAGSFIKATEKLPLNIFIINGDADEKDLEAIRYENTLKSKLSNENFDLIMLGMGEDGHIASLFPNTIGLTNETDLIIANNIDNNNIRYTFSYQLLNRSDNLWFLISGQNKLELINDFNMGVFRNYPFEKLIKNYNNNVIDIIHYNTIL